MMGFLWDLSQLFLEGHLHWETNHSKRAVHLPEESCFFFKAASASSASLAPQVTKPRQVAADATGSSAAA